MTDTWLPWAIRADMTEPKYGYPQGTLRSLADIQYVVQHSAEGGIDYLKQGNRPGDTASWLFSNALDGTLYQHGPLEWPAYTSGGPSQNIHGVGVEHAGDHVNNPKFTDAQADSDCRLYESLVALCPNLLAPSHGAGIRIHREVAPGTTSCPNNRERWDKYEALATGGDDMPLSNDDKNTIRQLCEEAIIASRLANRDQMDAVYHWLTDLVPAEGGGTAPRIAVLETLLKQAAAKEFTGTFTSK